MHGQYLAQSVTKVDSPEFQEIKAELDKAFELDPNSSEVLLALASYSIQWEKDFPKAQQLLDSALEKHPEDAEVYLLRSHLKLAQNDAKAAAEELELGLKQATLSELLLERLIDIRFQMRDMDGVRKAAELMTRTADRGRFRPELIRYEEARIKQADNEFSDAARELEAIRPAMARFDNANYTLQIDMLLGQCYEMLGQPDRQLEAYRRILQAYPGLLGARLGEAGALQALGKYDQAAPSLIVLAANVKQFPASQSIILQLLLNDQMQKPEGERSWDEVDKIAELLYANPSRTEVDNILVKSELAMLKGQTADVTSCSPRPPSNIPRKCASGRACRVC